MGLTGGLWTSSHPSVGTTDWTWCSKRKLNKKTRSMMACLETTGTDCQEWFTTQGWHFLQDTRAGCLVGTRIWGFLVAVLHWTPPVKAWLLFSLRFRVSFVLQRDCPPAVLFCIYKNPALFAFRLPQNEPCNSRVPGGAGCCHFILAARRHSHCPGARKVLGLEMWTFRPPAPSKRHFPNLRRGGVRIIGCFLKGKGSRFLRIAEVVRSK